jgi:hypothetical protein
MVIIWFVAALVFRKRREVIDLTAEEFRWMSDLQDGAAPSRGDERPVPSGEPLFSDRDHGPIKVYLNGIQARFVSVDEITLTRLSTGIQKRYVASYRTMFYPWDQVAGIYPLSINVVRRMGKAKGLTVRQRSEGIASVINEIMAYADDGLPGETRKDKFATLQVETTDYQTAVLSPSISRGVCDMRAIMGALGRAMGPIAKQKVQTGAWLRGFYLIFEEPGNYDVETRNRYRGERTRIMLGDIHKHFVLRSRPGYPQRRRMALETLTMRDVRTLDERLGT